MSQRAQPHVQGAKIAIVSRYNQHTGHRPELDSLACKAGCIVEMISSMVSLRLHVMLLRKTSPPLSQAPVPQDYSGQQRGSGDDGDDLQNEGVVLCLCNKRQQTCSQHVESVRSVQTLITCAP